MPNRILREGILTSARVNRLSDAEEVFYRRLMSTVDDFGRCEAHPALLRAALYPLKLDKVNEARIGRLLQALAEAKLVTLYHVDGKDYVQISDFRQQTRSNSRHPPPPEPATSNTCAAPAKHVPADAHLGVVGGVCVVGDVVGGVVGGVVGPSGDKRANRPSGLPEVVAYAVTIGMSEFEAAKFFDHFEANGWRQGGRAVIRDWRAACRGWHRRSGGFEGPDASGKKRGGGGPAPFNPTGQHAHTGGIPVLNDGVLKAGGDQ